VLVRNEISPLSVIQECGPNAVGIVTLISFLVGVILAFMGAVQLSQFGASIYVADLVGIGMVRDMRDDDGDYHVGPHRRRVRRETRNHEGDPGN
jgi:hypothetical protein